MNYMTLDKDLLKAQAQRKFLKMHPGKKQFPQLNLHYKTSLTPTRQATQSPSEHKGADFSSELQQLRNLLESKEQELQKLKRVVKFVPTNKTPNESSLPMIPLAKTNLPKQSIMRQSIDRAALNRGGKLLNRSYERVNFKEGYPSQKSAQYLTKRSPKALANNTITGLPFSIR